MENQLLKAALAYAAEDIPIIPLHTTKTGQCSCRKGPRCKRPGKHPRFKDYWKKASTDPRQIKRWWTKWPDANIGGLMGYGLLTHDIDNPPLWEAWRQTHGLVLPPTRTFGTHRGEHRLYRGHARSCSFLDEAGFENIGMGSTGTPGYIVLPPSLHPSGTRYRVIDDGPIADAPPWLPEMAEAKAQVWKDDVEVPDEPDPEAYERLPENIRAILEDTDDRSRSIFRAELAMLRLGMTDAEILSAVCESPAGTKVHEQGLQWLVQDLGRAKAKSSHDLQPSICAYLDLVDDHDLTGVQWRVGYAMAALCWKQGGGVFTAGKWTTSIAAGINESGFTEAVNELVARRLLIEVQDRTRGSVFAGRYRLPPTTPHSGLSDGSWRLRNLRLEFRALRHDAFRHRGLGTRALRAFVAVDAGQTAKAGAAGQARCERGLAVLHRYGLVRSEHGDFQVWRYWTLAASRAAVTLGTDGAGARQKERAETARRSWEAKLATPEAREAYLRHRMRFGKQAALAT